MKQRYLLAAAALCMAAAASGQRLQSDYIDWGPRGTQFPSALEKWQKGGKWTDDDNFFISRVRPKARFRNAATQVNPAMDESVDKKLIFWVPINNQAGNALPDGYFDSEVFPFWQYVTHYGNWSCALGRIPGAFADAAHKNGVPVSSVAGVPYGQISSEWEAALEKLTDVGATKLADYLQYYGHDGIGYNSEFLSQASLVEGLNNLHGELLRIMRKERGNEGADVIWYDGTNSKGIISFDRGLNSLNAPVWGDGETPRSSLFFNYNWNSKTLLQKSVDYAATLNRTPLDLYAGINMQGREPKNNRNNIWTLLKDYPISIGLWGAHSQNMFYEGRFEHGSTPDVAQRTYMDRMENWFTGSSRNPITTAEVNNSLLCSADNDTFFGMSKLMTARSSLKWDLATEPFITHFNLGNGRFFNWQGVRANNAEWYNIGVQDYLPTWRWWWASSMLGRDAAPAGSIKAEFVWDDAWTGGSLVRIAGTSPEAYLHLFKTDFTLRRGDIITVRYKIMGGKTDAWLSLGMKGSEATAANEDRLRVASADSPSEGLWTEKRFVIDEDMAALAGADMAVVALHFKGAEGLDMRLGEFSVVRPGTVSTRPATPVIEKATVLAADRKGTDAKLIFNMPNSKPAGEVCYNADVNTSMFKLYFRMEGEGSEPRLMGITTSWAALMYRLPVIHSAADRRFRIGVSALSMDMTAESDIAWSEPLESTDIYRMSDDINVSHSAVQPGEQFQMAYADGAHEPGKWEILDAAGNVCAKSENTTFINLLNGLKTPGSYSLRLTGPEADANGERKETVRIFDPVLQVVAPEFGATPRIYTMTADGKNHAVTDAGKTVTVEYTANSSEGKASRGVEITRDGVGFKFIDADISSRRSNYAFGFWFKPYGFADNATHMLNIRDKNGPWAANTWGFVYHNTRGDGRFGTLHVKGATEDYSYTYDNDRLNPGVWYHIVYSFRRTDNGYMPEVFINGRLLKPTQWTKGGTVMEGDPTPIPSLQTVVNETVAIGGPQHTVGTVRGVLDNFSVWSKENFSEADAKTAMGDMEGSPEGLLGLFDFEDTPGDDNIFANRGPGSFGAFSIGNDPTETEGQSVSYASKATIVPGSPYVAGRGIDIATSVEWKAPGGTIGTVTGGAESGKADVTFAADGYYDVILTMTNAYGSTSRTLPVYVGNVGVDTPASGAASDIAVASNPFGETLEISLPEAGRYDISLYDTAGACVFHTAHTADNAGPAFFTTGLPAGIYLLRVAGAGGHSASFKVIRR